MSLKFMNWFLAQNHIYIFWMEKWDNITVIQILSYYVSAFTTSFEGFLCEFLHGNWKDFYATYMSFQFFRPPHNWLSFQNHLSWSEWVRKDYPAKMKLTHLGTWFAVFSVVFRRVWQIGVKLVGVNPALSAELEAMATDSQGSSSPEATWPICTQYIDLFWRKCVFVCSCWWRV